MCGLQGHIRLLRRQTWLLEPRAQGSEATHLAGAASSVVGHHGASAQVPWYRCDHIHYITLTRWAAMTPLTVFLFSAVRGSRGEAHLSDVEGNGSQPSESLSRHTRVTRMIWLDLEFHLCTYFSSAEVSLCFSIFLHLTRREEGEMGRFMSLIQGMVTQLDRQHGCIWTSEDCIDQCYPPPNLQALLKLVLVPHIDNMSVQALVSISSSIDKDFCGATCSVPFHSR